MPAEPVYREHRREAAAAARDLDTRLRRYSISSVCLLDQLNLGLDQLVHTAGINPNAAN